MTNNDPAVVNKFASEADATTAAKRWSKDRGEEFSVIYGQGDEGMAFFVERGDGGMIRNNERFVARYRNGSDVTNED